MFGNPVQAKVTVESIRATSLQQFNPGVCPGRITGSQPERVPNPQRERPFLCQLLQYIPGCSQRLNACEPGLVQFIHIIYQVQSALRVRNSRELLKKCPG